MPHCCNFNPIAFWYKNDIIKEKKMLTTPGLQQNKVLILKYLIKAQSMSTFDSSVGRAGESSG